MHVPCSMSLPSLNCTKNASQSLLLRHVHCSHQIFYNKKGMDKSSIFRIVVRIKIFRVLISFHSPHPIFHINSNFQRHERLSIATFPNDPNNNLLLRISLEEIYISLCCCRRCRSSCYYYPVNRLFPEKSGS